MVDRSPSGTRLPLGDVGRYRNSRATHLRTQPIGLGTRKVFGELVDVYDRVHRELPRLEIPMTLDGVHRSMSFPQRTLHRPLCRNCNRSSEVVPLRAVSTTGASFTPTSTLHL